MASFKKRRRVAEKQTDPEGKTPRLPLLASCFAISQVGDIGSSGQHFIEFLEERTMQLKVQPRTNKKDKQKRTPYPKQGERLGTKNRFLYWGWGGSGFR